MKYKKGLIEPTLNIVLLGHVSGSLGHSSGIILMIYFT